MCFWQIKLSTKAALKRSREKSSVGVLKKNSKSVCVKHPNGSEIIQIICDYWSEDDELCMNLKPARRWSDSASGKTAHKFKSNIQIEHSNCFGKQKSILRLFFCSKLIIPALDYFLAIEYPRMRCGNHFLEAHTLSRILRGTEKICRSSSHHHSGAALLLNFSVLLIV